MGRTCGLSSVGFHVFQYLLPEVTELSLWVGGPFHRPSDGHWALPQLGGLSAQACWTPQGPSVLCLQLCAEKPTGEVEAGRLGPPHRLGALVNTAGHGAEARRGLDSSPAGLGCIFTEEAAGEPMSLGV